MSVSKAILSGNFKELESAVEGKTNEVYSTLLFDSYDDKRIEELLFLEAYEFIKPKFMQAFPWLYQEVIYKESGFAFYESLFTSSEPKESIVFPHYLDSSGAIQSYDRYNHQYPSEQEFEQIKAKLSLSAHYQFKGGWNYDCSQVEINDLEYECFDFIMSSDRYRKILFPRVKRACTSCDTWVIYFDFYYQYAIIKDSAGKLLFDYINKLKPREDNEKIKKHNADINTIHDFLLTRLCERHALNEHMVSSMKKKLEIERLYYHMKDLYVEDSKLTQEINAKREQLNTLNEDICSRKIELSSIENRIINAQNELEASIKHLKSFEISNEIEYENTFQKLSTEEQHILECKYLHEYYIQNANDLKIYRLAFENMRGISMDLQREKEELEEWKATETEKMEEKIKVQEEEFKRREAEFQKMMKEREAKFDADCESYEIESTKWKTQMESKFSQYQSRIDNYPELKDERDSLKQELAKLQSVLARTTKERDEFKTTIETLMAFRK